MKKYNVNTKKVLLYGAATRGSIIRDILNKKGLIVEAFIDLRANEIGSYCELPVYTIEQAGNVIMDKDEYIVYIDLKNVFEHDAVAIELNKVGFKNLLFRPGRVLLGTGNENEKNLNSVYDKLVEEDDNNSFEVYAIEEVRFPEMKDFSYIDDVDDDYCLIKVPTVVVYTDLEKRSSKWEDISIYGLYPHIGLFEGFAGRNLKGVGKYIAMCENAARIKNVETTDKWRASVLKNRSEVYDRMQISYDYDFNFFERNAVEAKWNDKGYFNICSGKHRCTFLIAKGADYIILKVKKEDYQKFIKQENAKKIEEYIVSNKLLKLNAPIEYPLFANYPCANYQFYYGIAKLATENFIEILFEEMHREIIKDIKIYLDVKDEGFLKRHFLRLGADVSCENSESSLELLLDDLFEIDKNKLVTDGDVFDFGIVDRTKEFNSNKKIKNLIIIDSIDNASNYETDILLGNLCRNGKLLGLYLRVEN